MKVDYKDTENFKFLREFEDELDKSIMKLQRKINEKIVINTLNTENAIRCAMRATVCICKELSDLSGYKIKNPEEEQAKINHFLKEWYRYQLRDLEPEKTPSQVLKESKEWNKFSLEEQSSVLQFIEFIKTKKS